MSARQANDQMAIGDGLGQRFVLRVASIDVLGVVRHADDVPRIEPDWLHQAQLQEAGVGHRRG